MRISLCIACLCAICASAVAGPLTGQNLIANGGFDTDSPGTTLPSGWSSFVQTAGTSFDGVTRFEPSSAPGFLPGHGLNCFGDQVEGTGSGTQARITQPITPVDEQISQAVRLWLRVQVYTHASLDGPGHVQLALHQAATGAMWTSGQLSGSWNGREWVWADYEFDILEQAGFRMAEVVLTATLDSPAQAMPGWPSRGIWMDGLELEILPEPAGLLLSTAAGVLLLRRRTGSV